MPDPSYYYESADAALDLPAVGDNQSCQICVIGGGFAGMATAIGLAERGARDITLLESKEIGHGASGRNGGFIFGGFSLSEEALLKQRGESRGREMYQLTVSAVETIKQRVKRYQIDCDLNQSGILLADWFGNRERLLEKQQFLKEKMGVDWTFIPKEELRQHLETDRYFDGLLETSAAHFHPLKYLRGLSRAAMQQGVTIYEHSPVKSITGKQGEFTVHMTNGTELKAEQVVICAGGYIQGLEVKAASAILPIATYVVATEPLGDRLQQVIKTPWAIWDTRFAFDYYRPLPDQRLLWGGRISARNKEPARLQEWMRRDLRKVFPQLGEVDFDYCWQGLMGYPRHKMPMVAETQPGLWHCIGFGGHGVAPTTAMGELAASAIAESDQKYRWFEPYQLKPAYGFAGRAAAQATYWWAQTTDAVEDWWRNGKRT